GNRDAKCFLAAHLEGRVANRLAAGFNRTASDEGLQPFARQGRNRGSERTVEPPTSVGRLQAHVDRLNSPHSLWNMGFRLLLFNVASLRRSKLCPINGLQ